MSSTKLFWFLSPTNQWHCRASYPASAQRSSALCTPARSNTHMTLSILVGVCRGRVTRAQTNPGATLRGGFWARGGQRGSTPSTAQTAAPNPSVCEDPAPRPRPEGSEPGRPEGAVPVPLPLPQSPGPAPTSAPLTKWQVSSAGRPAAAPLPSPLHSRSPGR